LIDPPNQVISLSQKEALETSPCYPPIGLAYLASVLRENSVEVRIIDAKSRMTLEELSKEVEKEEPDVAGVNVFTYQLNSSMNVCKTIKNVSPETKVVVGSGSPTSCFPQIENG